MLKVHSWVALAMIACLGAVTFLSAADNDGFVPIFDGKTLNGWEGDPGLWRVEDGAIVGQSTKDLKSNTFLIYKGGEPADFVLKAKFKIESGNSGIQYRSKHFPGKPTDTNKWVVGGYQADIDAAPTGGFTGILYEERGRGILAQRGTTVVIPPGVSKTVKPEVQKENKADDSKKIIDNLKKGDWNDYEIIAKGNHLIQKINGLVTVDVTDNDPEKAAKAGIIAFQLHVTKDGMKVCFKDVMLKKQ